MAAQKKTVGKRSFAPLGDRVIVERIEAEEVSSGGIIIAEVAREKPVQGVVISVGEGKYTPQGYIPINVKVGDTVAYGKYSGIDIELDRKSFLILRSEEIIAKVVTA